MSKVRDNVWEQLGLTNRYSEDLASYSSGRTRVIYAECCDELYLPPSDDKCIHCECYLKWEQDLPHKVTNLKNRLKRVREEKRKQEIKSKELEEFYKRIEEERENLFYDRHGKAWHWRPARSKG